MSAIEALCRTPSDLLDSLRRRSRPTRLAIWPISARVVSEQAFAWPIRWRPVLRQAMAGWPSALGRSGRAHPRQMGEPEDVASSTSLREVWASATKGVPWAADLHEGLLRVADLRDMGHVSHQAWGSGCRRIRIRRKVLSLICFLLTKPGFMATRDQVLEALWPDLEPAVAVNSLNQTVYFLRRVFEDPYREDESANYLHHDGEVVRIWIPALATSQSGICRLLAERARSYLGPRAR